MDHIAPKEVKRRNWVTLWQLCNAIAAAVILTIMYGGWVIVTLDCFGVQQTAQITVVIQHKQQLHNECVEKVMHAEKIAYQAGKNNPEEHLFLCVWWQNGVKGRFPPFNFFATTHNRCMFDIYWWVEQTKKKKISLATVIKYLINTKYFGS